MVTSNPLLVGARGGLGKVVVFKQMYGKTVMTNYPRKVEIPRDKQSTAQRETRDNFRDAVAYARAVLQDPKQKAYYEKKKKQLGLTSAYQAAITDYMRRPKLASLNLKKYTGAVQGEMVMTVTKVGFGVKAVVIKLLSERTGALIESGDAVKDRNGAWVYRNTVAVENVNEVKVQVMVRRPGDTWEVPDTWHPITPISSS